MERDFISKSYATTTTPEYLILLRVLQLLKNDLLLCFFYVNKWVNCLLKGGTLGDVRLTETWLSLVETHCCMEDCHRGGKLSYPVGARVLTENAIESRAREAMSESGEGFPNSHVTGIMFQRLCKCRREMWSPSTQWTLWERPGVIKFYEMLVRSQNAQIVWQATQGISCGQFRKLMISYVQL